MDLDSFVEVYRQPGDARSNGCLTGWGEIDRQKTFVFCLDDGALDAAGGPAVAAKVCDLMELAVSSGGPILSLHSTTPGEPAVSSFAGYGRILDARVRSSGVVPQIALVMGNWLGASGFGAALADVCIMAGDRALMHVHPPEVVRSITGEVVTADELGGSSTHETKTGVADLVTGTASDALAMVRYLLSFLPDNCLASPPYFPPTDDRERGCELEEVLPTSVQIPYDAVDVIREIVDDGELLQMQEGWAKNVVTALTRLDGHVLGVVANQPSVLAGTLDIDSSVKAARFVRMCDAFNIPLLSFVDTPGFRPGVQEEFGGIIRHGAKLVYAFAEATVPRVTLIARKAYGGAYIVMNSRHIRADASFAWPTAEIAVMGAEGAARIIHRREIAKADDPASRETVLADEYRSAFSDPYRAAERGYVDAVIEPADTRRELIRTFEMLRNKRETLPPRKHGNVPL